MKIDRRCHACGKAAKSVCTGCRLLYFCSKECQVASWPSHKAKCKLAKKEAKPHLDDFFNAAQEGNMSKLRYYLEKHPIAVNMVHSRNFGFITVRGHALEKAAANGHLEAVKLLIGHGANLFKGDPTFGQLPIHRACEGGHIETVKYLLEKGSPILDGDGMGQTPLHFAAEHGHTKLCQFLLDNGARPSLTVRYRYKTPKDWAELGGYHDCAAIL